jgi:hypothetical protein
MVGVAGVLEVALDHVGVDADVPPEPEARRDADSLAHHRDPGRQVGRLEAVGGPIGAVPDDRAGADDDLLVQDRLVQHGVATDDRVWHHDRVADHGPLGDEHAG